MSDKTGIQWTDATWNPVRGCSRVSEGCRHCYAETVAARFSGPGQPYEGLALRDPARWTGKVVTVEKHLDDPLRWTRPRRVFVNSMSDLFHESLSNDVIAEVFARMALAPRHTFQVLTKRAERMRAWFAWVAEVAAKEGYDPEAPDSNPVLLQVRDPGETYLRTLRMVEDDFPQPWPLPNVWLGVSVEDQARADERIPLLLETPAVVRFVSYEPALGPVNFMPFLVPDWEGDPAVPGGTRTTRPGLDWLIVGGESGPGARPCDLAWLRGAIGACTVAHVPIFVKQLGAVSVESVPVGDHGARMDDCRRWQEDRKGGDPPEWPEDLRVREFPR